MYKAGDIFKYRIDGSYYILSLSGVKEYVLISLTTGYRWRDPMKLKDDEVDDRLLKSEHHYSNDNFFDYCPDTVGSVEIVDKPKWYHNIPKIGMFCWVSDQYKNPDNRNEMALIKRFDGELFYTENLSWKYAVPLNKEEIAAAMEYLNV